MKNRKERWMSAGAAACCLLCLLPSCAKQTKIEEGEDFVYCINGEGTGLFKVVCDISQETPDDGAEVAIYSLVNSLLEGTGAGSVQIMVNGEKNASYQETVDLSQPLERDLSWEEEKEEE